MRIEQTIIDWYDKNKRDLPWRNTKNPYKIWISEIILQQTRVNQGLDYYLKFIKKFPDVKSLADADENEVLKYWQGLGYYSRARNLHFSARYILNELNGNFPSNYKDLLRLKGVGEYTAAAIASFAYNENVTLIDGNVFRLLSRLFGIFLPIDALQGKKAFYKIAKELVSNQEAQVFNQAIMEFGAMQCKPVNPNCNECPLNNKCVAYDKNKVTYFPVKSKKIKVKKRYLNYLYIVIDNTIFLKKRTGNDIWKGLYEFPLIETQSSISFEKLTKTVDWINLFSDVICTINSSPHIITHQLSHQQLIITFYHLLLDNESKVNSFKSFKKVKFDDIDNYAVPKVIENYLIEKLK